MPATGKPSYLPRAIFSAVNPANAIECGLAWGQCGALHKTFWDGSPFCLWNEYIASSIGHFLRLPIPSFSFSELSGRQFFSSLDFNFDRDELPPIIPDCCWEGLPDLSTGVLLFDILIANCDRHDNNLVVDRITAPKAMRVFDHDQSLLGGGMHPIGIERLELLKDRLGVTGSATTKGTRHCLLREVTHDRYFEKWLDRIWDMPHWFIQDICAAAVNHGMPKAESQAVCEFVLHRAQHMEHLIRTHQAEFEGIKRWSPLDRLFRNRHRDS